MSAIAESWDDLDEHLADFDNPDLLADELAGDSDKTALADRMVRSIARHRRLLAADEAAASAEIEHVQEWLAKRRSAHDTSFIEAALAGYHEARLARDGKAKTIHLPSGSLVARKLPDRWEFDDDAFLAWAAEHRSDLVRTKVEVDRPAAKKALVAGADGRVVDFDSGEFLDCVRVEPGAISFAVKTEVES